MMEAKSSQNPHGLLGAKVFLKFPGSTRGTKYSWNEQRCIGMVDVVSTFHFVSAV